ncbi:ABC transporter permease [bacterium 1XD42-8]|jgi:osmoprotectant transport system permease protein|nr:ABC transporter permease [Lachnospiraceae bacterium]RKJ45358.1 ABC transporter permease [bacterium 1XD42-8]
MELVQSILTLYVERWEWFAELLGAHILLSITAISIAGILGLCLGILIAEYEKLAPVVIGMCNIFYTIPAISLLGILIPFLGIGDKTAVTALSIYAMMPMVRNTYAGITSIDKEIVEAARGMGSTRLQILFRIKLPLADSIILTGIRSMAVMTISVGGIASFIGAGGLGVAIYRGITIYNPAMTFAGSLLIALLALSSDFLIGCVEKNRKKRRRISV